MLLSVFKIWKDELPLPLSLPGKPPLTYSHHAELHLLLHGDFLVVQRQEEGALDGAAVRPRVIEGHVVNENGSSLNVIVEGPMPLQTLDEIFMEDVTTGVIIVENLGERRKKGNP